MTLSVLNRRGVPQPAGNTLLNVCFLCRKDTVLTYVEPVSTSSIHRSFSGRLLSSWVAINVVLVLGVVLPQMQDSVAHLTEQNLPVL